MSDIAAVLQVVAYQQYSQAADVCSFGIRLVKTLSALMLSC